jgi:hypothetical protein
MPQTAIFGPFFATILVTFVVWVYMYVVRIRFIRSGALTPQQLQSSAEFTRLQPPSVASPSDNLKNLFEIPVLFYALALFLFATGQVDSGYVIAGWIFAVFRALHSAVHCTFNLVMLRFNLYLVSTLAVWWMVARAALAHFGS